MRTQVAYVIRTTASVEASLTTQAEHSEVSEVKKTDSHGRSCLVRRFACLPLDQGSSRYCRYRTPQPRQEVKAKGKRGDKEAHRIGHVIGHHEASPGHQQRKCDCKD